MTGLKQQEACSYRHCIKRYTLTRQPEQGRCMDLKKEEQKKQSCATGIMNWKKQTIRMVNRNEP